VAQVGIYGQWASVYERFERDASIDVWRCGIVPELTRHGCGQHRILDLGAGTGIGLRILWEAFPESHVVCLDQSAEMLSRGDIPPALAVVGDMTNFVFDQPFDFVVSGFDALNYLSTSELASCFACVSRSLQAGGKLMFDYSSRKLLKYDWSDLDYVRENNGVSLVCRHLYEPLLDRTRVDLRLTDGHREIWRETHYHYSVDPFTMHELAAANGLEILYGRDIDAQSYSPGHTTHVWVFARCESRR
jgi:SAM-dependent methyltransferase